jgi:hypothetical protein
VEGYTAGMARLELVYLVNAQSSETMQDAFGMKFGMWSEETRHADLIYFFDFSYSDQKSN